MTILDCLSKITSLVTLLKTNTTSDIVDTTPSNGNPYKMLRGAIDKDFDTYGSDVLNGRI